MSTLAEIRNAAASLPEREQKSLMNFLSRRLTASRAAAATARRGLKAAGRAPLAGLPRDLSTDTKHKARALMAKRHAAHR